MDEQSREALDEQPEQKPAGYGVDRTQIRARLELTPEERLRLFVNSAHNVAELISNMRVR